MGARDNYETVARVVQAFAREPTWKQAELARHVEVGVPALKNVLEGLQAGGMPLESEVDHPHVYWSVPKSWFPGGVHFALEDVDVLVHAVLHVADDTKRKKLLARLLGGRRLASDLAQDVERLDRAVTTLTTTREEEVVLLHIQRSILDRRALYIRYFSTSRGDLGNRHVSPLRLVTEPHARLIAYCHKNRSLRWFRVANVERARLSDDEPYVATPESEVDEFHRASPDGFHDGTSEECTFLVKPEAMHWVRGNLVSGMSIEEESARGLRVKARGGTLVIARFVLGMGGSAVAESEPLKKLVRELAQSALEAHE